MDKELLGEIRQRRQENIETARNFTRKISKYLEEAKDICVQKTSDIDKNKLENILQKAKNLKDELLKRFPLIEVPSDDFAYLTNKELNEKVKLRLDELQDSGELRRLEEQEEAQQPKFMQRYFKIEDVVKSRAKIEIRNNYLKKRNRHRGYEQSTDGFDVSRGFTNNPLEMVKDESLDKEFKDIQNNIKMIAIKVKEIKDQENADIIDNLISVVEYFLPIPIFSSLRRVWRTAKAAIDMSNQEKLEWKKDKPDEEA